VMAPLAIRRQAWDRLASDLDLDRLKAITEVVQLDAVIDKAHELINGKVRGRVVVEI
jgi:acrylyl-CoA reductase (NADPH)